MVEEYGRRYDLLTAALAEVPCKLWEFKPAPGEGNVYEIIDHMKDSESMGVMRLHKLIAEPGSTLMTYEEDKWTEAMHYHT